MNEKTRCPHCGRIMMEREIGLYDGIIKTLWRVYVWCEQKGLHEFERKEIRHLFRTEGDTARFGDLVLFGGLVYKKGKGHYGLNMERCKDFFDGKYQIPCKIIKGLNGELRKEDYRTAREMPSIMSYLNSDGEFQARYRQLALAL